jgi:hypothetical protein
MTTAIPGNDGRATDARGGGGRSCRLGSSVAARPRGPAVRGSPGCESGRHGGAAYKQEHRCTTHEIEKTAGVGESERERKTVIKSWTRERHRPLQQPERQWCGHGRTSRGIFNYLPYLRMPPLQKSSLFWQLHICHFYKRSFTHLSLLLTWHANSSRHAGLGT